MWRRGALSHRLLPRAPSQGRARSHLPCPQLPSTVTKVGLCRAAPHPGHLRASVHQGGATAEDARTGGLAGNWQAVHCQLSDRDSSGLFPQLLEKKKKSRVHILLLEKEIATHSSTLAWRIPWTEEPGGLQPMGSQRVGHD